MSEVSFSTKAVGILLIVIPDPVEKTTKSGIVLATDEKLERGATESGVVYDVGAEAFRSYNRAAGFTQYVPWVKPGDHIYFSRYAGKWVKDKKSEVMLLIIRDEDVCGLVE